MSDNIMTLDLTTWQGISLGATHYYGDVVYDNGEFHKIALINILTEKVVK